MQINSQGIRPEGLASVPLAKAPVSVGLREYFACLACLGCCVTAWRQSGGMGFLWLQWVWCIRKKASIISCSLEGYEHHFRGI